MDNFGEQPKFEIQPVIEQKPFENPAVQSFFAKWCEINDSIQPQLIDRDEWEKRGIKGVLEKRPDDKTNAFCSVRFTALGNGGSDGGGRS